MQDQHSSHITPQEWLELERQSETKSEYWNGEIHPMGRVNAQHSLLVTNAIANLGLQHWLRAPIGRSLRKSRVLQRGRGSRVAAIYQRAKRSVSDLKAID